MIIFSGVEIPSNRTLLERSNHVENVMLSYWGLRKRGLPKTKIYLISEHFPSYMKVWIDSGATQADLANMTREQLEEYAAEYEEFVANNYDRIEGWVEFDSQVMGFNWILQQRDAFDPDNKMWIVWHEKYGTGLLNRWSSEYRNIAIPGSVIDNVVSLAGITRGLKAQNNVDFHALGTAKPDNLRQIPFTTASTLSWLSPMRRGETIVWDGQRLVRYQKSMKAQARPRYKRVVEGAGLDFQKFLNDEDQEATKVAIWSYLQLEKVMDKNTPKHKPMLVDNSDDTLYTGLMETGVGFSNNSGSEMRKVERQEVVQRDPNEVVSMPVVGYRVKSVVEMEDGRDVLKDVAVVETNSVSLRQCDTCFVAANCPAFKPANTCAFSLPIEVKTPEQLKALNTALLEMQAQRVMFMRFAEELNGGYADPNVSQEIDRYQKMLKNIKELDETKEFIQITGSRNVQGGVLSAIFGDRASQLKDMQQPINEEQTTKIIRDSIE
jgi:hypothetical protein